MKAFLVLSALLLSAPAYADRLTCRSDANKFFFVVDGLRPGDTQQDRPLSQEVSAFVHVSGSLTWEGTAADDSAKGGLGQEAGKLLFAFRTNSANKLLVARLDFTEGKIQSRGQLEAAWLKEQLIPLTCELSETPVPVAAIECRDDLGKLAVRAAVPANVNLKAVRNFEIKEGTVHIDGTYVARISNDSQTVDDLAHGGLKWDEQGGQLAVRSAKQDILVSLRTGPFVDGVATGRFEDGAGPQMPPATCHFIP